MRYFEGAIGKWIGVYACTYYCTYQHYLSVMWFYYGQINLTILGHFKCTVICHIFVQLLSIPSTFLIVANVILYPLKINCPLFPLSQPLFFLPVWMSLLWNPQTIGIVALAVLWGACFSQQHVWKFYPHWILCPSFLQPTSTALAHCSLHLSFLQHYQCCVVCPCHILFIGSSANKHFNHVYLLTF